MPYEGEFAQNQSLRRLVQSDKVKQMLGSYRVRQQGPPTPDQATLTCITPPQSDWKPDWVLAVDGSYLPVTIENGFPGAEAAYVTVASVMIDVAKLRDLDKARPIDPVAYRKTRDAESVDGALPGCNVICNDQDSAPASMRQALYEVFRDKRVFGDGESLLDTYHALLAYKPQADNDAQKQGCPYGEDCPLSQRPYTPRSGQYACSCSQHILYSTDALRIHDGMNPAGPNGSMYQEIMQVWERIWLIHILRALEAKGWLGTLRRMAFVLDGPLAVFGHPAWLSQAIYRELCRLNEKVRVASGTDVLLIGVEKTGFFAEHLILLDKYAKGEGNRLPARYTALISDAYIKQNIIFSDSERLYGRQTYFGRKFFYKTVSGALIVAQLPFLAESHRDTRQTELSQYPRLSDALNVLEEMVSSRYQNAVTPLVEAHAEAAIPLNLGRKVLESLARELMGEKR